MMKHTNHQGNVMLVNKLERKYLTEKYDTSVNFQGSSEQCGKPYEGNKKILHHCYEDKKYIAEPSENYVYKLSESSKPANMNGDTAFKPVIKFVNDHEEYSSDIVTPDINYLTKEQRYQFKSFDITTQPIQLIKVEGEYGKRIQTRERYIEEAKPRKKIIDRVAVGRIRKLSDCISSALTSLAHRGSKSFNLEDAYGDKKGERNGMNTDISYEIVTVGPEGYDPEDKFEINNHFSDMKLMLAPITKDKSVLFASSNCNDFEPPIVENSVMCNTANNSKIENNILEGSVAMKNSKYERTNNAILINKSKSSNYRIEDSESPNHFQSVNKPSGYSPFSVKESTHRERASIENLINDCKVNNKGRRRLSLPTLKRLRSLKNKSSDKQCFTPAGKRTGGLKENVHCQRNMMTNTSIYTAMQEDNVTTVLPRGYSILTTDEATNNKTPTEKNINTRPEIPVWKQAKQVHIENTANNGVYRTLETREGNQNSIHFVKTKLEDIHIPITRNEEKHSINIHQSYLSNTLDAVSKTPSYVYGRNERVQLHNGNYRVSYEDDEDDEDVLLNKTIEDIKPEAVSDWSNNFGRRSFKNKLSGYTVSRKYRFR